MSILAINGGSAYQIEAVEGRHAGFFDAAIRPEEIARTALAAFDCVIVLCRTPAWRMEPVADRLLAYLDRGGTMVAMGECHSERWLPGISFEPCETNFWWWLTPGADLGTQVVKPQHALFSHIGENDIRWHLHGSFDAPEGAEVLATNKEGRAILYVDEVTTRGRMIVTSLDPFFHHGHHFMPATTRFLDGFLPWLQEDIKRKAAA
ncbi:hypothetical protein [Oricola sp.]|uniref:hypothetical protein n=1 Tax=Oricola sp. TaxID=1979950 RepID=UPI0025FDE205|nr:hypothetical protein [Oricola sp.]MCI5073558.1 hypothetical protein [Oricola sp.]